MIHMKFQRFSGFLLVVFLAFFLGILAGRYFRWKEGPQELHALAMELEVFPDKPIDWRKGIGEDVEVEVKSFVVRDGRRVLDGPSMVWVPVIGNKRISFYKDGELQGVESLTVKP